MATSTPAHLGSFQIIEEIGRGSGGVVFRARGRAGTQVAVKTVLRATAEGLQSLRREYSTLARLDHPGVVRLVAEGLDDATPWYAMDLVPGRDLLSCCREFWRPREGTSEPIDEESVGRILTLGRAICEPLSYLHGEGVVHRDLKPCNVLVTDRGSVVLVDFGLMGQFAGRHGRELFEAGGAVVGTAAYMAPEQWRGELVDARADIYSLGAILYVLLTGLPPFSTRGRILDETLSAAAASRSVAGIDPAIDKLLARLLAKRPEWRIGYADDVASILGELGAAGPAPRRGRDYLYRPALAGRAGQLAAIESAIARASEGTGEFMLLSGESGVGKTRLMMEAAKRARAVGMKILAGECESGTRVGTGEPLGVLRGPLRAIVDDCRVGGAEFCERLIGWRAPILAAFEPAFALLPCASAQPAPPDLDAEGARLRLHRCLSEVLAAVAAEQPLLLVLDDLQWADELSVGFLRSVLEGGLCDEQPLLVMAGFRSEESSAAIAGLAGAPGARTLTVTRLAAMEVAGLVGGMLAVTDPPAGLAAMLARDSDGNPFFVAEYLRAAVSEGMLRRDEHGRWRLGAASLATAGIEALPLPAGLRELVARHVAALSRPALALLRAASVVGREAETALLAAVSGMSEVEVMRLQGELVARQILEEGPALRFLHDKVREAVYVAMEETRRRELHRTVARVLEDPARGHGAPRAAELAHHWLAGGELSRARPWVLRAARGAADRHALDDAERLYRFYLELATAPEEERVRARSELAMRVQVPRGRTWDALAGLERCLAEARDLDLTGLAGEVHRLLGSVQLGAGRMEDARANLESALAIHGGAGMRAEEGRDLARYAELHLKTGRLEEARPLYARAGAIFAALLDRRNEADVLTGVAVADWQQGRMDESHAHLERALALIRETGDRAREGRALVSLAGWHHNRGEIARALELYDDAAAMLRAAGDLRSEGIVLGNLAVCHEELGRATRAAVLYEQALQIARLTGDRGYEGRTLLNLASLRQNQGDPTSAERYYHEALRLARSAADRAIEGTILGNLGELLQARGELDAAEELYGRALAIHREVGERRYEGHVLGNLAGLHQARGRIKEARSLYRQALRIAGAVGDRQYEGLTLCRLAALERRHGRSLRRARELLERADRALGDVGESMVRIVLLCERGHQALAERRVDASALAEAAALADTVGAGPGSDARLQVDKLAAANEALDVGARLVRGEEPARLDVQSDSPPVARRGRTVEGGEG